MKSVTYVPGMDGEKNGASERSRTSDLPITNRLLYQLSYAGAVLFCNAIRRSV